MAVMIELEDGQTIEYRTCYKKGGEFGPGRYKSSCGGDWEKKPDTDKQCDHMECAIRAAEQSMKDSKYEILAAIFVGFVFLVGGYGSYGAHPHGGLLYLSSILLLVGLSSWYSGWRSLRDLKGFNYTGKIRGKSARVIK